jgi:SPP1 gp7 family putative phage head morphogenesis protein
MKTKSQWQKTTVGEAEYARDLRSIAREIGKLVNRYSPGDISQFPLLRYALEKYSELLRPWAVMRAQRIIEQANVRSKKVWASVSKEMSAGIKRELQTTPIGARVQELMNEQVKLITSLPKEAGERVHKLVLENASQSNRPPAIAKEIARSGEVAASRATLIARTEVSRVATVLTQARAESVGSTGYIWRTAHDVNVRPSHKVMEGKFVEWGDPPTLDGLTGHAGALPNCRCYPEPVFPKEL